MLCVAEAACHQRIERNVVDRLLVYILYRPQKVVYGYVGTRLDRNVSILDLNTMLGSVAAFVFIYHASDCGI